MAEKEHQLNPPAVAYPPHSYSPQPQVSANVQQPAYGSPMSGPPYPQQQCTANVVMAAPTRPNNYLNWSVSTAFFFCLPLGIAALIYSAMVDSKYDAGKYEEAARASRIARILNIIGMIIGSVIYIISLILTFIIIIIAAAAAQN